MNIKTLASLVVTLALTSGCGVIPRAYQGTFIDETNGAKLELKGGEGILQTSSGKVIQAKAEALTFEKLQQGTAGIYVIANPTSKDLIEIHWIGPRPETKKEAGGLTWFESEVLYTFLDIKSRDKADAIELAHCENGTVLLDPLTKRWQIGCPAGTLAYFLKRAQNSFVEGEDGADETDHRGRR